MNAHFAEVTRGFVIGDNRAARAPVRRARGGRPSVVRWLLDMPRRRAVINELAALSDHELADIGLSRADVPRVFDTGFRGGRVSG